MIGETMHCVSVSSSCFSVNQESLSKVKKKSAVFKRAMAEKRERWQNKVWYGKTKSHWRQLAGEEGGQRSHDKWRSTKPQGKRKEISAEIDPTGTSVKENTNTLNKSCKESARRKSELYKMVEQAAIDERQEHKEGSMLKHSQHQLQRRREEEDEARGHLDRTTSRTRCGRCCRAGTQRLWKIMSKVKQAGWNESTKATGFWRQDED